MNDVLFASLRASAKAAGTSVKRMISDMSPPEFRIAFPDIDTGNVKMDKLKAGSRYDSYKEMHFRRLYLSKAIESTGPGEGERRAKIDAERKAEKNQLFGARYGKIKPGPRTEFEFLGMDTIIPKGSTVTGRNAASTPTFQEIGTSAVQKLTDRLMREHALALDREIMTACYGKTGYAMAGTCTGRMAGTEPNIGQIPKHTATVDKVHELYDTIRKVMIESESYSYKPKLYVSPKMAADLKRYCVMDLEAHDDRPDSIYGMPITVLPDLKTLADINVVAATTEDEDMNTEQLRAALAESEAADAKAAAAKARDDHIAYLQALATATSTLLGAIRYGSTNPVRLGRYVKELKPLATELGAKLYPTATEGMFSVVVAQ